MTPTDQIRQDLGYVAAVLRRSDASRGVPAIYWLWAGLLLVGFALPDFAPFHAGTYWLVAGPLGGLASFVLGWRAGISEGVRDPALGMRYAWHWSLTGLAALLVGLPVLTGTPVLHVVPYFLLVIGLAYALAGVHLEPPLRWAGLLMMAGYAALAWQVPYAWTITGVLVAVALGYAGWQATRR